MPFTESEKVTEEKESDRKEEYRKILNSRRKREGLKADCMQAVPDLGVDPGVWFDSFYKSLGASLALDLKAWEEYVAKYAAESLKKNV